MTHADNIERATALVRSIDRGLFIDGRFVPGSEGRTLPVHNPADGSVITEVAEATHPDVDLAVAAAGRAFRGPWSEMSPSQRGQLLWRLADRLEEAAADFALVETLDNGKPLVLSRSDVDASVEVFRYYAGWAGKVDGRSVTPTTLSDWRAVTLRQPLGVVAQIIPWNFPLNMASWKLGPALATGNTVVLKPSELTPLTALMLARLVDDCGFPPGVVNVIPGYGSVAGAALAAQPDVTKVAFTGSVETGQSVARAAIDGMKRVSLELGGKSPSIVLPDADPALAIAGVTNAIFTNQGEVCTAGARAYVHASQYDEIVEGITKVASAIVVGDGLDPAVTMGPLVSSTQLERVRGFVSRARDAGADIVAPPPIESTGYFMQPCVIVEPPETSEISREEVFGPVLVVQRFEEIDEVIDRANDSTFGLAAGIWGRDIATITRLAERLQAGSVWVNGYHAVDPALPFGGWKSSGWGRELGPDALDLYTETKSINVFLGTA